MIIISIKCVKESADILISLRKITRENIDEVLALKVNEDQRSFVTCNGDSLAQAYVIQRH